GNDFIAMLKDSSLVSVLAVPDLVQQARFHISRTFQPFEVWNLVALTYLVMTATLSLGVRALERRARVEE
ncbi:MAG: amino acid ABC transporter permease, partial [Anaerolineae bacterium]